MYADLQDSSEDFSSVINDLSEITDSFVNDWMPFHSLWIKKWVLSYVNNVIVKYPLVRLGILKRLKQDRPAAILYSKGSENILDELIARTANELNIPVFCFKHSSVDNLFVEESIFDPYFERDQYVKRIQFLSAELEERYYVGTTNVKCVVSGSLYRPKSFKVLPGNKKILYSVGPPTHHIFREMGRTVTDYERYRFAKMLVDISSKLDLTVDIKIHPAEAFIGYSLFSRLLEGYSENNFKILPEGTIDRIYKHYGLIVLDMISTRVLSSVLNLNIPVFQK